MRRFLFCTIFLLLALTACQQKGVFRPEVTSVPISNDTILGEPILVSFTELANNLERYQNTLIRVTGNYTSLAKSDCYTERGPRTRWSLVSEGKQMKILRFEQVVVPLAWDNLSMTLDGIWRKYEGPLGCGKNAPDGVVWYLEAVTIVEPNPIPEFFLNNAPPVEEGAGNTPEATPFPGETPTLPEVGDATPGPGYPPEETPNIPTPNVTPTTLGIPTSTPSLPVTMTPTGQATTPAAATQTPVTTSTPTPTPTLGTGTPTGTPTVTPGPGTPSVTPLSTTPPEPTTTGYPPPPY